MLLGHENNFHSETAQHHPDDDVNPLYESERMIAASMIVLSFVDYHKARKLIQDEKITYDRYWDLCDSSKEVIKNGMDAKSWFLKKPKVKGTGWTLERCCNLLHYDIDLIRSTYLKASAYRDYKRARCALGGMAMEGRTGNNRGEKHACTKIKDADVKALRARYKQGGITQKKLAELFGISTTHCQRIIYGESRA